MHPEVEITYRVPEPVMNDVIAGEGVGIAPRPDEGLVLAFTWGSAGLREAPPSAVAPG